MKRLLMRLVLYTGALLLAAILLLPTPSRADEFNLKTYITVNQPVQVPGAVLLPDVKYVFRRVSADSGTNHLVRVLNADETKVLTTFFAISDQRLEPADKTILTFYETAPGYATPVRSWFYPGREIGLEFLYPKAKMTEITAHLVGHEAAAVQTAAVQTTSPAVAESNQEVDQSSVEQGTMAQNTPPEIQREPTEVEPEMSPVPSSVGEQANTTVAPEQNTPMPGELPRTAGELPLLGLIGLVALGLRMRLLRH